MVGEKDAKFAEKRRFDNMAFGNKKGEEDEGEGEAVSPWMPISTIGMFYGDYTSSYVFASV